MARCLSGRQGARDESRSEKTRLWVLDDLPVGKLMQRQTDADKRIPQTRSSSSWSVVHHHVQVLTSPSSSRSRFSLARMAEGKGTGLRKSRCTSGPWTASTRSIPPPDPYSFPDLISSSTASSSLHEVKVRLCLVALPASGPFTAAARRWGQKQDMQGFAGPSHLFMHLISLHRLRGLAASQSFLRTASLARKKVRNFAFETILNPAFALVRGALGPWDLPL
jgi:hypothetical protein